MNDLTLFGLVIPGVIVAAAGAVASAIWSHLSQRRLARLEDALEARRVVLAAVHGPRVTAAVDLWSESAAFEGALRDLLLPYHDLLLDEDATREERRESFLSHETRAAQTLSSLFPKLLRATATAECLLGGRAGAQARALADGWSEAHALYWASRTDPNREDRRRLRADAREAFDRATAVRAELLAELQGVLSAEQA
ncbi:MAG: hypothetical protein QM767_04490 [Anaeromyxobacter sp.]